MIEVEMERGSRLLLWLRPADRLVLSEAAWLSGSYRAGGAVEERHQSRQTHTAIPTAGMQAGNTSEGGFTVQRGGHSSVH